MKVKIRIAVAMNDEGYWSAIGHGCWSHVDEEQYDGEQDMLDAVNNRVDAIPVAWVEAEVEYPEPPVVSGKVTAA